MLYKSAVKTYVITILMFVSVFFATIYISDPYMLFHKHWFNHEQMLYNMRIQDYGLIKFGKFDGIIIGTSMLENTSSDEAKEKLNVQFANLSLSGGSLYERFKILNMALNTRPFKHIIMSLDYKFNRTGIIGNTFEPDLYSTYSLKGKFMIYLTDVAIKCIFSDRECNLRKFDLDHPNAWYKKDFHARRFGGFENWIKYAKNDHQIQDAFAQLRNKADRYDAEAAAYKQVIDQEILPLFKHKDTEFSIIIPPYSALYWAKRKNSLDTLLKPYQYLIEQTAQMSNVKIYWFYDEDFVFDISKYKDLTHYHHSINSLQLDAIKNGTNIINMDNYEEKFDEFCGRINHFNLQSYIDKIENSN